MISIILRNVPLDLYSDTDITWSWTDFRFRDKLGDQYTNNFTIPKTENNIKALGIYSTLDSKDVQFGEIISPADFVLNGDVMSVYIQVISVTDNEIEVAIFEDTFAAIDKNQEIQIRDNYTTILEWNKWSMTNYPDKFVSYNYGIPYNWEYAQRHPYVKLKRDILDKLDLKGYQFDPVIFNQNDWRILCSKKVVCPENTIQVLEYINYDGTSEEGGLLPVYGGQHVCNDLAFSKTQTITYNRDCYVQMTIWYGWSKINTVRAPGVYIQVNGQTRKIIDPYNGMYAISWGLGVENFSIQLHKGDKLTFYCDEMSKFNRSFSMVVKLTTSAYQITEDDYNTELLYQSRLPYVKVKNPADSTIKTYSMNGTTYSTSLGDFQTERLSFSYFGQYCNIPKMKLGDLLYSLQWLIGGELKEDKIGKLLKFDANKYFYPKQSSFNELYTKELNKIEFHSDKVGKKNYIKYKDEEFPIAITTINNKWLEEEKVWHEVIFHYFKDNLIKQYSLEVKKDIDYLNISNWTDVFDLKFNEIENPVIFNYNNGVEPIPLKYFDMENLWFSKEIEFSFYDAPLQIREIHDIIIDGRTYYVISGEQDVEKKISTIRAILVQYDMTNIEITRIYNGINDGEVYVEINIESKLPLKNAYLDYQKVLDPATLVRKQLNLQTGTQIVLISGLTPGQYMFLPASQNVSSNFRGIGRAYTVQWNKPYCEILNVMKDPIVSTNLDINYKIDSNYPLNNASIKIIRYSLPGHTFDYQRTYDISGTQPNMQNQYVATGIIAVNKEYLITVTATNPYGQHTSSSYTFTS